MSVIVHAGGVLAAAASQHRRRRPDALYPIDEHPRPLRALPLRPEMPAPTPGRRTKSACNGANRSSPPCQPRTIWVSEAASPSKGCAPPQADQGSTHVYVDSTRASHNTSAAAPSNSHRTQLVSNQRSKPVAWPQNLTHRGGGRVSSPSRGLEPSTGEHAGAPRATKQRERRRRVGGWWSHPVRPRVGG